MDLSGGSGILLTVGWSLTAGNRGNKIVSRMVSDQAVSVAPAAASGGDWRMRRLGIAVSTAVVLGLAACATPGPVTSAEDASACERSFTSPGNFVSGRSYQTAAFIEGIAPSQALERAEEHIRTSDFRPESVERRGNAVVADVPVRGMSLRTVPLTVDAEPREGGTYLAATLETSAMLWVSGERMRDELCSIVDAVRS